MTRVAGNRAGAGVVAGLLSALLPGLGQIYAGRRRRGWILLAITIAVVAGSLWVLLADRVTTLSWTVRPDALRWLLVANGVFLVFRATAAVDAFRCVPEARRVPRGRRAGIAVSLLAGAIIGILTIPHAIGAYYDLVQLDLITTVFAPPTTTTTAPPVTMTSRPSTTTGAGTTAATTTSTTTTTRAPRFWDGTERLNILLLGGDAGVGRTGVRTDTIIALSIDPSTGDTAMFSVPRNMAQVPLPDDLDIWACDCFPPIINELWDYGTRHPDAFPGGSEPGAEALKLGISELLGIEMHYYALVNLDGFVALVDAIGGIDINVPERVYDAAYPHENGSTEVIDITPGQHHMDGHLALAYARSRHASSDYNRMGRQRCVIQAAVEQATPGDILRSFPKIAAAIKDSLTTDIPLDRLPELIELLPRIDADQIVSIPLYPPTFTGSKTSDGYNTPDVDKIREYVAIATQLPAADAVAQLGIEPITDACDSVDESVFTGD